MKSSPLLLAFGSALLIAACDSSTGGGGGAGGTSTSSSSSSSTSSSTSSGVAGGCLGDATVWAELTTGPITCSANADCCVIVNGCTNEAQIVAAADKTAAKAAWPYCDDLCTSCIPPAVEVRCDDGVCAGTVIPFPDASTDLLQDHCGVDAPITVTPGKLHFGCGD